MFVLYYIYDFHKQTHKARRKAKSNPCCNIKHIQLFKYMGMGMLVLEAESIILRFGKCLKELFLSQSSYILEKQ